MWFMAHFTPKGAQIGADSPWPLALRSRGETHVPHLKILSLDLENRILILPAQRKLKTAFPPWEKASDVKREAFELPRLPFARNNGAERQLASAPNSDLSPV
jgi:hypothetical protein